MNTNNFLLELGTEELPPKLLQNLSCSLGLNLTEKIEEHNLSHSSVELFSTPRRIAVVIRDLQTQQDDQVIERKGPSVDAPIAAIDGFAKSCGTIKENLVKKELGKKDYYFFSIKQKGKKTAHLLESIVETSINKIPIARPMRWGDSEYSFVRPVHWLVMMLGKDIVPATIMGLDSSNVSRGLRYSNSKEVTIDSAEKYQELMYKKAGIDVDFVSRKKNIRSQIMKLASEQNATAVIDESLLDEVCCLVEYPVALSGRFDSKFLSVPEEAIISAMKSHQKYFHMTDKGDKLLPAFITIANTKSIDTAVITHGNERVITPRLSDAEFFWDQDKKTTLESRLIKLDYVIFMKSLGSMGDKVKRIESLAKYLAKVLGANVTNSARAGLLSKSDLVSEMVGEFADLQGIMGGYYAINDGESEAVSVGIREHYKPRFAGDSLPASEEGIVVSIADKIDTITGIYGIGQGPTGSKDPYALRRMALGLLRIMVESELDIDLKDLIFTSLDLHSSEDVDTLCAESVYDFMMDRLRSYYKDMKVSGKVFDSVLVVRPDSPYDFHLRVLALNEFINNSASGNLIEANKRISNMLKENTNIDSIVDPNALVEVAEKELYKAALMASKNISRSKDYSMIMIQLLNLKDPIDTFFEDVMVNVDDDALRNTRLSLLYLVRSLFLSVADVSHLS
jgi:glycyl-tRNA synthetase beta chain